MELNVISNVSAKEGVFSRYVQALITATLGVDGNVLTLAGSFLLDRATVSKKRGNAMFLRPVYDEIMNLFDVSLGIGRAIVISGSTGVGKTSCVNPYIRRLLRTVFAPGEQVRTIIVQKGEFENAYFISMERSAAPAPATSTHVDAPAIAEPAAGAPVVAAGAHVTVTVTKQSISNMDNILVGDIYHIVDVNEDSNQRVPLPTSTRVKTVLFTSPNSKLESRYEKHCKARILYMPLWTLQEL